MDWDQAIAAAKSGCTVWKPDSDDSEADPTASESGEPGPIGKRSRSMRSVPILLPTRYRFVNMT